MIGMPRADRLHAVKLFRQHPAHQKMRPGKWAEREPIFGPRLHSGIKPFRPPNHVAGSAPGFIPAGQQRGQAFRIGHRAPEIERDGRSTGRDGGQDGGTFPAANFSRAAARFGDFKQFRRRAQPRRVMGVKR